MDEYLLQNWWGDKARTDYLFKAFKQFKPFKPSEAEILDYWINQ